MHWDLHNIETSHGSSIPRIVWLVTFSLWEELLHDSSHVVGADLCNTHTNSLRLSIRHLNLHMLPIGGSPCRRR